MTTKKVTLGNARRKKSHIRGRDIQTAAKRATAKTPPSPQELETRPLEAADNRQHFPIAGIGASAGGLEAFKQLLEHLPVDLGMAFILVPHLDPSHESLLTDLLSRTTKIPIQE